MDIPQTEFEAYPNLGVQAHVKKAKVDKLESYTELCLFVGYPKETKGGYFYSPKENKVFVSTNARFLEDDHIRNHKSNKQIRVGRVGYR